jgi:hypothetical protein
VGGQAARGIRSGLAAERLLAGRGLVVLTGLAAALPVIVSCIRGLAAGWVPEGDQAIAATRAYDVFTSGTPLVGAWSTTTNLVGHDTFHPGPLLYWLLAVPVRLPGVAALTLTMAAVSVAAVIGVVALAHRRGGRPLMFVTAAAVAVMFASLQTEVPREIWTPSAPVVPFTLLIFLCWSVACGDHRLLPLVVLTASFVVQCHVVYLVPSLALVAVALVGLALSTGGRPDAGSVLRWVAVSGAVAAICWSAPIIDQALDWAGSDRGYGNLESLVELSDSRPQPVGRRGAAYAVVRAVGVPPWWLRAPQPEAVRAFEIFVRPSVGAILSALAILGGLAGLGFIALRRRRWDVVTACSLALVLCGSLAVVTASFPNGPGQIFPYAYASWWVSPTGMFVWLALGWSAVSLLPRRVPAIPAWSGLAAVACVAAVVALSQGPDSQRDLYAPTRDMVEELEDALPEPASVRVDGPDLSLRSAAVFGLRRNGADVGTDFGVQFGADYELERRRFDETIEIAEGAALPPGSRPVTRVETPEQRTRIWTVSLRPGD